MCFKIMLFSYFFVFIPGLNCSQQSQKMVKQKDGSLIMFLKCRGHRELIWELLHSDWLGNVKIESPERLQEEYLEQLERAKSSLSLPDKIDQTSLFGGF